jgi:hypothetical protein
MKALRLGGLLAMGLVLAVGAAQAAMMQSSGGLSAQQLTTSGRVTTAPASSGVSPAVFIGHGAGFEGQPSPAAQFAHPGHTIIHPQAARVMNFVPRQGDAHFAGRFARGAGFDHDRFLRHRRSIVVFVNGVPCWYPVYTAYPSYYDVPPPVTYSSADYPADGGYVPPTDTGPAQAGADYGDVGMSWGQDLRREVVTWDQFVAYLKAYIVTAPPSAQADFREAFIGAYRINGDAAYDKAAAEAAGNLPQPSGPKIITMPSPRG